MLHNFHTTTVSLSDDKSQLSSRSLALRVFFEINWFGIDLFLKKSSGQKNLNHSNWKMWKSVQSTLQWRFVQSQPITVNFLQLFVRTICKLRDNKNEKNGELKKVSSSSSRSETMGINWFEIDSIRSWSGFEIDSIRRIFFDSVFRNFLKSQLSLE